MEIGRIPSSQSHDRDVIRVVKSRAGQEAFFLLDSILLYSAFALSSYAMDANGHVGMLAEKKLLQFILIHE